MTNKTTKNLLQNHDVSQCSHTAIVKEVAFGSPTGNYICMQCRMLDFPWRNKEDPNQIQWVLKGTGL